MSSLTFRIGAVLAAALTFAVAAPAAAGSGPSFPIPAAEYRKTVEKRVDQIWDSMQHKLKTHNVSADRQKAIRRVFDDAAKDVWAEVEKASSDGTITKHEADRVRSLTSSIRGKVRGRLAAEKKVEQASGHVEDSRSSRPTKREAQPKRGNEAAAPPAAKKAKPAPR